MNAPLPLPGHGCSEARGIARLRPALIRFFRRKCGNKAEAEDLAHDVLVRVLAHDSWQSADQVKGYVFRAAMNRWRDRGRRELVRGNSGYWNDVARLAADEERTPEHVLMIEQEISGVSSALQELSERTRDILVLVRLEQMKHREIAEAFDISVSAVEKHLAKALAHLARYSARRE